MKIKNKYLRYFLGYLLSLVLKIILYEKFIINKFRKENSLLCVYFHNPSPKEFERFVKWITYKKIGFVSESEVIYFLDTHQKPVGSVWLTLDDGWASNLDLVRIIEKYNVPITLFLSTSAVKTGFFWSPIYVSENDSLKEFHTFNYKEKIDIISTIESKFSNIGRTALSVHEIIEMAKNDKISFGLHTHHHLATKYLSQEELYIELELNFKYVSSILNKTISGFAYPHGIFSGKEKEVLEKFNIKYAVTGKKGRIYTKSDSYYISRYGYTSYSFLENISRIFGCW